MVIPWDGECLCPNHWNEEKKSQAKLQGKSKKAVMMESVKELMATMAEQYKKSSQFLSFWFFLLLFFFQFVHSFLSPVYILYSLPFPPTNFLLPMHIVHIFQDSSIWLSAFNCIFHMLFSTSHIHMVHIFLFFDVNLFLICLDSSLYVIHWSIILISLYLKNKTYWTICYGLNVAPTTVALLVCESREMLKANLGQMSIWLISGLEESR